MLANIFGIIWAFLISDKPLSLIAAVQRRHMISYGGYLGAIGAVLIHVRVHRFNKLKTFDLFFAFLPIFDAFRRMGCFLAGCCYGKFFNPEAASVLRTALAEERLSQQHPVPLYFMGLFMFIFIALRFIRHSRHALPGDIMLGYFLIYCPVRFVIEFFRVEPIVSPQLPLNVAQLMCLGIFAIALIGLYFRHKLPQKAKKDIY